MDHNYDDTMARIKLVSRTRTQNELAKILEIKQSCISDSKKRHSIPADWYLKLFGKLGVNPDWLKNGVGPVYLRTEAGYFPCNEDRTPLAPVLLESPLASSELVTVYSMRGKYTEQTVSTAKLQPVGRMALSKAYSGEGIVVLEVDNAAASPTVLRGSHVGIDTTDKHPASGEIFAILIPSEGIVLRKVFWKQDENCFILRAENTAYPEIRIQTDQTNQILGRLSWVMQAV